MKEPMTNFAAPQSCRSNRGMGRTATPQRQRAMAAFAARAVALCALAVSAACAPSEQMTRPLTAPSPAPANGYPCSFVELDASTVATHENEDTLTMFAVYRFNGPAAPAKHPLALKFQVNRSRVNDLQEYLQSQPTVLCEPEEANFLPRIKPFEGQSGK